MNTSLVSKRMAILVRRASDSRDAFSRHWREIHGAMVARLPKLRCYVQSHVIEDFVADGAAPAFRADGFVEQQYDSIADMQEAYASAAAKALLVDEPNYLGHATNYETLATGPVRPDPDGRKLVLVVRHGGDTGLVRRIERGTESYEGCVAVIRDDVIVTIPKAGMREGPQQADAFLQVYFDDVDAARRAGSLISEFAGSQAAGSAAGVGVYRVNTVKLV